MAKKIPKPAAPVTAGYPPGHIDPVPSELELSIREDRCALFAGAGLSMGAGLPSWVELLNALVAECHTRGLISGARERTYKHDCHGREQ